MLMGKVVLKVNKNIGSKNYVGRYGQTSLVY
jgi:hypothetical protein